MFCEMCQEFHFVVRDAMLAQSRTKACGKRQHSAGGLSGYDAFRSLVQVPLKQSFSRISRSF